MKLQLLSVDCMEISVDALGREISSGVGRTLRRVGGLSQMAYLSCRKCAENEHWPEQENDTAFLWHSKYGLRTETSVLLETLKHKNEPVMPFDFLASQPALVGSSLHTQFKNIGASIFMPWVDDDETSIWQRTLLLAGIWLTNGDFKRIICANLDYVNTHCKINTVSMTSDISADSNTLIEIDYIDNMASGIMSNEFADSLAKWYHSSRSESINLSNKNIIVIVGG